MKNRLLIAAAGLLLTLSACDSGSQPSRNDARPTPTAETAGGEAAAADATYEGTGTVTKVADDGVTISHGAIAEAGWPAMAMTFTPEQPELASAIKVGDRVSFQFRKSASGATLTAISKL